MSEHEPRVFRMVPIARAACMRCDAPLRDSGLLIRSDGGVRCKRCSSLNYGLFAPSLGQVLLTVVTVHDLRRINAMESIEQVVAEFGLAAPFIPSPVLASRSR